MKPGAPGEFLRCATPESWVVTAIHDRATLLIDHANCEKKAAGTALSLLYRYVDRPELLPVLSALAREELLHFEQVVSLMASAGVEYAHLGAGRYARSLKRLVRTHEPARLMDTLLVGAVVEARSCERFERLSTALDDDVGRYYAKLAPAEERHFREYLSLARRYDDGTFATKLEEILECERELIESPDPEFRFHSGTPCELQR